MARGSRRTAAAGGDITPGSVPFVLGGIKPKAERTTPPTRKQGSSALAQVQKRLRLHSEEVLTIVRSILSGDDREDSGRTDEAEGIWQCDYGCLPFYGPRGREHQADCPAWERQTD